VRTRQEGGEREDRQTSLTCDERGLTVWFWYCTLASDTEKEMAACESNGLP